MRFTRPSWVTHQEQADQKRVTLYSCHVHPDGSRLATGGLDAKIRIWSTLPILDANADQEDVPKKLCTLTMHNDVTDLAWSPKDRYLASVGLDSKVIIWCGYTLDPLRKLDQHQGFVKGVCWDPVGEFLATQSDDKSVKVWRTTDWGLEATVTKPFQDSPGSTFFRRLSWSPDGAHITASNAMNNNGYVFVAAVIARNEWTSDICLVGHENTVEVAAYNPHIFLRDPEGDVQSTNICSVVALGADDLSVSIWQTKSPRPIIVTKEVFESPIYDLSWSTNGLTLYACSADGSLGVFDFDRTELDGIVGLEDKETYLQRFGFQPPPEAMPPQMKMHAQGYDGGGMNGTTTPAAVVQAAAAAAMDPGPAFDRKGRRRIKPVFISPLSTIGSFATSAAPAPYVPNASSAQPYSQPFPSANGHQASTSYPSAYPMDRSGVHHSQTDFRNSNQNMSFSGGFDTDGDTSMAAPANFYEGKYGSKRKASEMGDGDDASVSVSGAASSRAPKARTLGGDRAREPVGPIKELRPAISGYGFGEEAGGRARVRLVIPPLKSYITAKSDERDEDVFEGRNFDDGKPSEVSLVSGKQTQFLDYPPSAPLSLAVTGYFCACRR
ncbi:HIR complex subunit, partial [Tulasnella sp. 403]